MPTLKGNSKTGRTRRQKRSKLLQLNEEDTPTTPPTRSNVTSQSASNVVTIDASPPQSPVKKVKQTSTATTAIETDTPFDWKSPGDVLKAAKFMGFYNAQQTPEDFFGDPANIVKLLGKGKTNYTDALRSMGIANGWGDSKTLEFRIGAARAISSRLLE